MDRLKERLSIARKALATFHEILSMSKSSVVRDAAIQRFEYTFEAVWKAAQLYLRKLHGMEVASPKSVMRGSGEVGLLGEQQVELALAMADDRNLTVHTYNESLAEDIFKRLPAYAKLMDKWLKAMKV